MGARMQLILHAVLLIAGVTVVHGGSCSPAYGDCFNSTCCVQGNFGCMRSRAHRGYAQCRPLPKSGCADDRDWECPGWESCSDNHADCMTSKCCKDERFGCFKRPDLMHALCLPLPDHTCSDTAEWLCPGWELCSDNQESCEHTHCCSSVGFTCYRKHGNYAQCLRSGTCTDGVCEPVASELGQCSDAWHDCHLSSCCKRAEDHCYMKNHGYGKCLPHCDSGSNPDWLCTKREMPSEKRKLSCESLRERHSIQERQCSELDKQFTCNSAYHMKDNLYRPCNWLPQKGVCEAATQELDCDCPLRGKGCPLRATDSSPGQGTASELPQSFGSPMQSDDLTTLEVALMVVASIIICCGCGCACWWVLQQATLLQPESLLRSCMLVAT